MSTDWNVHCIDCNDTHTFNDANHCDDDMVAICKHAAAIAALAPLLSDTRHVDIQLRTAYGRIDVQWFARHAGHRLAPISEYGHLMGQCSGRVTCSCGSSKRCALDVVHDGDHDPVRRALPLEAGKGE